MSATADARATSSIQVHWIKNNILAAVISAAVSFALYCLRQMTGASDGSAGFGAIVLVYILAIVLWGFVGAALAVLTGAVLQRILPQLPVWAWIALHVAGLAVIGIGAEALQTMSPPDTLQGGRVTGEDSVSATLMIGFIAGAAFGAASGALQALVLRKVAFGTRAWITWSAIGSATGWSLIMVFARAWDLGSDLPGEVVSELLGLVGSVIMTLLMLPALQQLRSRGLSSVAQHFS
jgi:hypothetical protein